MRVAILEDDLPYARFVTRVAQSQGFACSCFSDGHAMLRAIETQAFDLLLLDWDVPGASGLEVASWVRANVNEQVPILFVSGMCGEEEVVAALTAGADDYLAKPVSALHLGTRISALMRRCKPNPPGLASGTYGLYRLDAPLSVVSLGNVAHKLPPKHFAVVSMLFENAGRTVSRGELIDSVWGDPAKSTSRVLDTIMCVLRRQLEFSARNGFILKSIYGVGYSLTPVPARASSPARTPSPRIPTASH